MPGKGGCCECHRVTANSNNIILPSGFGVLRCCAAFLVAADGPSHVRLGSLTPLGNLAAVTVAITKPLHRTLPLRKRGGSPALQDARAYDMPQKGGGCECHRVAANPNNTILPPGFGVLRCCAAFLVVADGTSLVRLESLTPPDNLATVTRPHRPEHSLRFAASESGAAAPHSKTLARMPCRGRVEAANAIALPFTQTT